MKNGFFIFVIGILLLMFSVDTYAQGKFGIVGKLYTQSEAKILFGNVISSVEMDKEELKKALMSVKSYAYLTIKSNKALIANDNRTILNSISEFVNEKEVMFLVSKEVLNEFLNKTASRVVLFERRATVLSLSSGDIVLEGVLPCPPYCWN